MRARAVAVSVGAAVLLAMSAPAFAATPKGHLFLNGQTVGTVVVSAPVPNGGSDPLFRVMDGVEGQLGIAGIGPGEVGYTGGDWAVYDVTFNVEPYLLTSDEAVHEAEAAGDVTVVRNPDADFRCPITKKNP